MTEKQKFALYQQIQSLGFSYEEAKAVRRIEIVLRRWTDARESCRVFWCVHTGMWATRAADGIIRRVADREAGALRRLRRIVEARNRREGETVIRQNRMSREFYLSSILFLHRPHPTEANLFLITRAQLGDADISTAVQRGLAIFSP